MRRILLLAAVAISLSCGGCRKSLTVADFPLKAGVTADEVADKVGSPDKESGHWVAYKLADKTELRLYFLGRDKSTGARTLTEAAVFDAQGMRISTPFSVSTTQPATKPGAK